MAFDAAERMDRMYRYQRRFYDLTRRHYLLGRTKLIADLSPPSGGNVLEIGCGTGWNLILAARSYPNVRFYGFDISREMLATARQNVAKSPDADRIILAEADATSFASSAVFGTATFDRVFTSYTLSMIPAWTRVLDQSVVCLSRRGALHVVDFGPGTGLPKASLFALRRWLKLFDVSPRDALYDEMMRLAQRENLVLRHESLFRGYAQHSVATRA
jgi:S-adenosylmethionine-diacylgycerolhomoserine-N-methlytransferase